MTKEQIMLNAYHGRLEELRVELNKLRLDCRHREGEIKHEQEMLKMKIDSLEGMK